MDIDDDLTNPRPDHDQGQSVSMEQDPLSPSTSNNSSRGRSKVWNQFIVAADGRKVICLQCSDSLAYSNSHSTSSMLKHLKRKHAMNLYPSLEDEPTKPTTGPRNVKKNPRVKRVHVQPEAETEPEPSIQHRPLHFKGQYCVRMKWTDHTDTFLGTFSRLYAEESYTDCTLVAEKVFFKVHRIILSSASEFFEETFKMTPPGQHPIIFLKDVKALELRILLDFIYKGEISIPPSLIQDLVRIGTQMKVRGLCDFQFNDNVKSAVSNMNQFNEQSDNSTELSQASSLVQMNSVSTPPLSSFTPLYNSPTVHTISGGVTPTKVINPVRTQSNRQMMATTSSSTVSPRTSNPIQKSWRSENLPSPPSHMMTSTSSNNLCEGGGPAMKRFRVVSSSPTTMNKVGVSTPTFNLDAAISGVSSDLDEASLKNEDGTILVHEGDALINQGITIVSPDPNISVIKTEMDIIPTSSTHHIEMHPITLVSHHMENPTENLDEVVYSITGEHGEVLISDTGEMETTEGDTIVVYGTNENVSLSNSCESVKKTL